MQSYKNLTLDQERALYGVRNARVENCIFDGPADGESALKESRNIDVRHCRFALRYPLWHCENGTLAHCTLSQTCRAALWYDRRMDISSSRLGGIKALRECDNIRLSDCDIESDEFGWFCRGLHVTNTRLCGEYPFMRCENMDINGLKMQGKYSFQYVKNAIIKNSILDTKDAFWHGENITVQDCVLKGEYLGWYSKNLTFERCTIIGTQPLCYCQNLVLKDCRMQDTDLSFEYSDVRAEVRGGIVSVKNPLSGYIEADEIGQIILDENQKPGADCRISVLAPQKEKVSLC